MSYGNGMPGFARKPLKDEQFAVYRSTIGVRKSGFSPFVRHSSCCRFSLFLSALLDICLWVRCLGCIVPFKSRLAES